MITFYCPACWIEVIEAVTTCPSCGADIVAVTANRNYVTKLIAALSHPEPTTPIRAAAILGQLKAADAIKPLLSLLRSEADPYIKAAAAEALGEIGGSQAYDDLIRQAISGPAVVRRAAAQALSRLSDSVPRR
jgi:HEAT repeat protein